MEFCRAEAQQLTARISAVNEKAPSELEMERLLHFYSGRQTYLKIIFDGEQWMNSFPDDAILAEHNGTVRVGNDTFYYYDSLLDAGDPRSECGALLCKEFRRVLWKTIQDSGRDGGSYASDQHGRRSICCIRR